MHYSMTLSKNCNDGFIAIPVENAVPVVAQGIAKKVFAKAQILFFCQRNWPQVINCMPWYILISFCVFVRNDRI